MSGHILTGGVFVSGTRSTFDPRVDDLEVDLTAVEEIVESATANISDLTTQQATNIYNIGQNDIGVQFNATDISTNTTNIANLNIQQASNTLTIANLDQVFVEKTGHNEIVGELEISGPTQRFSVDHSGAFKLGKISIGNTTNLNETFNGAINGIPGLVPDNFIATSNNSSSNITEIGLCLLNRAAGNVVKTPAVVFSTYGNYFGAELNHVAAIVSNTYTVSGSRHMQGGLEFQTKLTTGVLATACHMHGSREVYFYNTVFAPHYTSSSDDRIKENEELILNACDTLSKLKPQIYDKKPTIDNVDPTTWWRESGLIAQEIYYDAPELRHLVFLDEDLDSKAADIDTSMDPQEDPDYSSWPEKPASVNYTGLIAYLIKANNELNDRLKTVEAMLS